MADRAPAFQFYPKDFLSDRNVMAMSYEERGVYITLLCICWLEGSIPADLAQTARALGMTPRSFGKVWTGICSCFEKNPEGFVHPRLEKERSKQAEWRDKSKRGGQLGAAKRWQPDRGGHEMVITNLSPTNDSAVSSLLSASASPVKDVGAKAPRPKKGWKIVPDEWQPNDGHRKLAKELGVDLAKQVALFRDHEFQRAKTDADRTFNTWLRRASEFTPTSNRAPSGSEASRFTAGTERKHYQQHANGAAGRDGQAYVSEADRVRQWQLDNRDEAMAMFNEIRDVVVQTAKSSEEADRIIKHTLHQRIVREKLMKVVA
jgi:uncharacterized protein YdaU (DUF1376 family)